MKKLLAAIATVGALALIVLTLINNKAKSDAKVESQKEIISSIPVSVKAVEQGTLSDALSLTGTIVANNDVTIAAETQGRVKSVHAKVGDVVQSGSTIVQVDDELRQAGLISAQANYDKAKADFDRTEALFNEKAVAQAQLDAAKLGLKAAEAQLITARRQLKDTRISSPIGGVMTARPVDIGTTIQPGMNVATVVDISALKVKVNVAEADVFKLKTGEKVAIATEVYPNVTFEGRITNISVKGDEAHTYPVEIALPNNKQNPLKAGMFARVAFTSVQPAVRPIIPREALVGSIKDARVFVVENGSLARLRSVTVGSEADGKLSIVQGLQQGEMVVTNGQNNLKDGVAISVVK